MKQKRNQIRQVPELNLVETVEDFAQDLSIKSKVHLTLRLAQARELRGRLAGSGLPEGAGFGGQIEQYVDHAEVF